MAVKQPSAQASEATVDVGHVRVNQKLVEQLLEHDHFKHEELQL